MHIAEGVLSAQTLAGGAVLAAGGVAIGLRKLDLEAVPRVAVLASALFVASLIQVPFGVTSVHLILNGLAGLLLGWAVFPALLVAFLLQTLFFGFGGLTTLGVNTFNMAMPAVAAHYLFRPPPLGTNGRAAYLRGAGAGVFAIAGAAVLTSLALLTTGRAFAPLAAGILAAHAPILVVEGLVTGSVAAYLWKVRPDGLRAASKLEVERT